MNLISTNKTKLNAYNTSNIDKLAQPDLHHRILDIVANRMKPERSKLILQKQLCNVCVQTKASEVDLSLKKIRISNKKMASNAQQLKRTRFEDEQLLQKQAQQLRKSSIRQKLVRRKRQLQIISKVVEQVIFHNKPCLFLSDLQKFRERQLANKEMLRKLQILSNQQQTKIRNLQDQLHIARQQLFSQMSFNLQNKSKQISEEQIPSSLDKISEINTQRHHYLPPNSSWQQYHSENNLNLRKGITNHHEQDYDQILLRIVRTQAIQLQKHKLNFIKWQI